jgi:hypothetical protein
MSLRAAVEGLAKRLGLGPAGAPAPCATCSPRATPGRTTRIVARDGLREACADCGRALDHTGAPIGVATPRGLYTCTISTDDVRAPEIA